VLEEFAEQSRFVVHEMEQVLVQALEQQQELPS
jgi:hypothetical protein